MQQTKTYQLNKIDMDDTFSPVPLNENMDQVDAKFAALDGADAALDSRVTALEGHKLAMGSYRGTGGTANRVFALGFTPRIVMIQRNDSSTVFIGITERGPAQDCFTIVDGGFSLAGDGYANSLNHTFTYIAIK